MGGPEQQAPSPTLRRDPTEALVVEVLDSPKDATQGTILIGGVKEGGIAGPYLNVVVAGGIVHIWGFVASDAQKEACSSAAPGRIRERTLSSRA
jgi:hypothetical protein